MPHLAHAIEPHSQQSRGRAMWLLLGALVVGQLFAFWLLCSHQVRKAEARSNEVLVHQMALSDCLRYIPGSTIASCTQGEASLAQQASNATAVTGAVPVSFSYR